MRAFTLIEILIVIGIIGVIGGIAVPVSISQISQNKLVNTASEMSSNLFLYQQYSYAKKDNKIYGVALFNNYYQISIYDKTEDEYEYIRFDYPDDITASQTEEGILFEEGGFRPVNGALIPDVAPVSITLTKGSSSVTIEVNREGLISHYVN